MQRDPFLVVHDPIADVWDDLRDPNHHLWVMRSVIVMFTVHPESQCLLVKCHLFLMNSTIFVGLTPIYVGLNQNLVGGFSKFFFYCSNQFLVGSKPYFKLKTIHFPVPGKHAG